MNLLDLFGKKRIVKGKWWGAYNCVACHKQLFSNELMYNRGTCPHCGSTGKHQSTVTHYYTTVHRYVWKCRWWEFWTSPIEVEQHKKEESDDVPNTTHNNTRQ